MQVSRTAMKWTGLLVLLLLGLASAVFAQPHTSRGGALKKKAYQTYAAMTLYVDPTGSDSNSCTASGTSACLTLGGALLKVPIHIRHLVTINVATGTYTEVFRVQGFTMGGANGAASTAGLTITGTQTAFTVATGTNTGTLTGYAIASGATHTLATDTGQGWTVNDLRGRFLQITGGTGSGQYMPIVSNTATVITLADDFITSPVAGSTYAIVTPGPVFTATTSGKLIGAGITGTGTVTISDISISPATGSALAIHPMPALTTNRVRITAAVTAIQGNSSGGPANWSMNNSYIAAGNTGIAIPRNTAFSAAGIFVYCTSTCAGSGIITSAFGYSGFVTVTGTVAGDWTTALISLQGPNTGDSRVWLDCGAGTNIGIKYTAYLDAGTFAAASWSGKNGPYINGCLTGMSFSGPSAVYLDSLLEGAAFTNVTNAVVLERAAHMIIEAGVIFTGVTNQLTIDGTVYTDADLTTFTRITGPQGSYATRP